MLLLFHGGVALFARGCTYYGVNPGVILTVSFAFLLLEHIYSISFFRLVLILVHLESEGDMADHFALTSSF
jgi:hypothetical protein